MQPQLVLRIAGIAALVIAALFAVLAVHYYLSQHIKAVMDDLSGKARAQGVAQVRGSSGGGRASGPRHAARPAAAAPEPMSEPARVASVTPAPVSEAVGQAFASAFDDEDGSGTVLVAASHAAADVGQVAGEDDIATLVDGGFGAASDEDDLATMVAAEGDASEGAGAVPFRLTKRIVLIHVSEVISTSEEPLV